MTSSWEEMGFGKYPVTELSHVTLKLSDGATLGMKVWLPCVAKNIMQEFSYFATAQSEKWMKEIYPGNGKNLNKEEKFPSILEYLPYSKDSWLTLSRDYNRHPWFCSHGYVVFRVDMRGTGSSSGLIFDEYEEQEFVDCEEFIDWVAEQNWSNQRLGMYGKSWGGFNGLQLAYRQPKALKTAISLYSTDSRYTDDMHYQGGTIIGNGLMSWAGFMFTINARPPHPRYFQNLEVWKEFWLKRLQGSGKSWFSTWLTNQHPSDSLWRHGSICEDYSKVKCPVLVIGGQGDGYVSAAFRMAASLNEESRAIIGPWTHQWPDVTICGPNIDYLNTCLSWWNYHLKSDSCNVDVLSWPRLSLYVRDSFKADDMAGNLPGKWINLPDWDNLFQKYQNSNFNDDESSCFENLQHFYFGPFQSLQNKKPRFQEEEAVSLLPHALQGANAGLWLCVDSGLPKDQSLPNEYSVCWKTFKLDAPLVFAGMSKLYVCLSAEKPGNYSIQVRVCDQFPSGDSTLITRGCLNLCSSEDGWVSSYSGERKLFCVNLNGTGYSIQPGHELLVSITPTYFPHLYPSIDNKSLSVHPEECVFVFQTVKEELVTLATYAEPKPLLELPSKALSKSSSSVTTKAITDTKYLTEVKETTGLMFYPTLNYECEISTEEQYITDKDVTFAESTIHNRLISNFEIEGNKKISTCIEARQSMSGCERRFLTKEDLKVFIDGKVFFENSWEDNIPRKYV